MTYNLGRREYLLFKKIWAKLTCYVCLGNMKTLACLHVHVVCFLDETNTLVILRCCCPNTHIITFLLSSTMATRTGAVRAPSKCTQDNFVQQSCDGYAPAFDKNTHTHTRKRRRSKVRPGLQH